MSFTVKSALTKQTRYNELGIIFSEEKVTVDTIFEATEVLELTNGRAIVKFVTSILGSESTGIYTHTIDTASNLSAEILMEAEEALKTILG